MGRPAAKAGDTIAATDTHIVIVPIGTGQVPVPLFHVFNGKLSGNLSNDVRIMGRPAATLGSVATNTVAHLPTAPGIAFQRVPSNRGRVSRGSGSVRINGKPAARSGDVAETCNDPQDAPVGRVLASGSVFIG
jgi:uncharacterized Zn-binding protein involved in type VI secretion